MSPAAGVRAGEVRDALRRGAWVTAARLRTYPLIVLLASLGGIAALWLTSDGRIDSVGRPLGTDFSEVWAAGVEVLAGHPAAPFDPATHAAVQRSLFGSGTQFYGWHYPPYFLALATVLALLPYIPALLLWQGATLPLYLGTVVAILRGVRPGLRPPTGPVLLAAAAFPAVFVNLTHGHNGFLTAALLAGGLLALERRPWLAGALLALLAYKPQFALALPVAMLAGGHWRTVVAGCVTLTVMTAATVVAFGLDSWRAFAASLAFTRTVVLEQGSTGWEKIQSTFSAARMLGAGVGTAYLVQGVVTAAVLLAVALVWRGRADGRLKAAILIVATLLTTPYSLDYDMMALGPAIAFAVAHGIERGFRPWEKSLLVAVWAVPGLARVVAGATDLPLGLLVMLAFFTVLVRHALPASRAWESVADARGEWAPVLPHVSAVPGLRATGGRRG